MTKDNSLTSVYIALDNYAKALDVKLEQIQEHLSNIVIERDSLLKNKTKLELFIIEHNMCEDCPDKCDSCPIAYLYPGDENA